MPPVGADGPGTDLARDPGSAAAATPSAWLRGRRAQSTDRQNPRPGRSRHRGAGRLRGRHLKPPPSAGAAEVGELLTYARPGYTVHISEMFRLVRGTGHILDVQHRDQVALRIHDGASAMDLTARHPSTGQPLSARRWRSITPAGSVPGAARCRSSRCRSPRPERTPRVPVCTSGPCRGRPHRVQPSCQRLAQDRGPQHLDVGRAQSCRFQGPVLGGAS